MTPEEKKIEEAANKYCLYERGNCDEDDRLCNLSDRMFIIGAKSDAAKEFWQKGMYTEEEVKELLIKFVIENTNISLIVAGNWLSKNKKKEE